MAVVNRLVRVARETPAARASAAVVHGREGSWCSLAAAAPATSSLSTPSQDGRVTGADARCARSTWTSRMSTRRSRTTLVTGDLDKIRLELDTHFYGTLAVVRAFAPALAANGGGAILNVLSRMSWQSYNGANSYAVAKAAQWSLTNGVRLELARQGTLLSAVLLSSTDTRPSPTPRS